MNMSKFITVAIVVFSFVAINIAYAEEDSNTKSLPERVQGKVLEVKENVRAIRENAEVKRGEVRTAIEEKRDAIGEKRDEIRTTIEEKREDVKEKKEERAIERGELKVKRDEKRMERIAAYFERVMTRLEAALDRLGTLANRAESRINKLEEIHQLDLTKARENLRLARTKIQDASNAVSETKTLFANLSQSETPRETFAEVKEYLRVAIDAVREAHRALVDTLKEIKAENTSQKEKVEGATEQNSEQNAE